MAISTNVHNDSFTRGDSFRPRITVKNTDGTPHDITGATGDYVIRAPGYEDTLILQKTVGAGIQLTAPASGILDVDVTPAETDILIPGLRYVYGCRVTIAGEAMTVQTGVLTVVGDVSV